MTTNTNTASGAAIRFTKKPVTIEAIRWTGSNLREVIAFTDGPPDTRTNHAGMAWDAYTDLVERDGLKIYTLEGKMLASPGDWIIRGVKGELYPCKDEIFRLTYSRAALASTPAQPVAILFEHEDGRYAVNPDTTGDPAWHRLGPVDISAIATPAQSGLADAYVGAREDLSIWKRRALEAEATVRNFVREVNSSTFMGDPVSDECPHGDAHIVNDCLRCGAPVCCGKCCAAESTPTAQADSVQEEACHAPPLGWRCTRKAGHEGPCAAVECEDDKLFVERGMQRIRDAEDAAQKEGE